MITLHKTDLYLLEGGLSISDSTRQVTLELFQTFPQARNPRSQRILSLTLPEDSFSKLAQLVMLASHEARGKKFDRLTLPSSAIGGQDDQ